MKQFTKRAWAMLLALVMCLSLISGLPFEAAAYEVDYNYQGSVVYNWGERGEECDFLSPMAEAFYADNNVTYDSLASLSGASSTSAVPSSAMYKSLQKLMVDNHSNKTSYDATRNYYDNTDCQNGGGKISSFYSGKAIGPGWGEGGSWNREHTWPNSKGLGGQDENDIMMLRPTATSENSDRGNDAYGESSGYYDPNDVSNGTYNLHGDVARIWLYVYVRWGNTSYAWGQTGVMESKEVLLKWMEEDPVDTWEMGRNDAVESITGTRNVFVDYPELAFLMFNEDVPAGYETPSGEGNPISYTVTAVSNNTSYGTVSVNGRTITATPKTGYYVKDYTVTSGSANVTQNGNVFTVQAKSDCTIRVNFAPKTTVTVSFYGTDVSSKTGYAGEAMTLPTVTAPEGLTFLGWVSQPMNDDSTTKPDYLTGSYTPTVSTSLYALYSYIEEGTGSGSGNYVKVTTAPADWSGEYVIVYEANGWIMNGSLSAFDATNNYKAVTVSNNTITAVQGDPYSFIIAKQGSGYSIQGKNGKYVGHGSNANGLTTGATALVNTIALDNSGNANIIGSGGAYLRFNANDGQNRFRYYKSSSYTGQKPVALYVKDGSAGTTYYTTYTGAAADKFAVYSGTQELDTYKTLNQALENYDPSGEYIKLLENAEVNVTLDDHVYIDLNGFYLTGTIDTDGYTVYGMDTTTDQYSCEDVGYFTCVDPQGLPVVPAKHIKTAVTGNTQRYLTIETDGRYSFHRFYMGITHATLRPGSKGVGYKAVFAGDDMVKACVDSFGYTLQLGTNTPVTASKAGTELVSLDTVTLRVENYDAEKMGTTELSAYVYMVINGETITGSTVTITLKDLVEQINAANDLTADQKEALAAWIGQSKTMQSWDVENLYTAE